MKITIHDIIHKLGHRERLSAAERSRMRSTLEAYMDMKPIRAPLVIAPTRTYVFWMRPVSAALVLALFVSTAGVSYAAEGALPGDLLYPVKVGVNEPVAGALAFTASAKASWAAQVAGTRVQEAAVLAAEGRLSTTTQEQLQSSFDTHARVAIAAIDAQATKHPDASAESAVRFEAQLSEYDRVLAQVSEVTHADVATLVSAVGAQRDALAAAQARTDHASLASAEEGSTAALAIGRTRDAAHAQYVVSERLATDIGTALASSSAARVALQLQSVSDTLASGNELAERDPQAAVRSYQQVLAATEQIGVFLKTSAAIHERTGLVITEPEMEPAHTARPALAIARAKAPEAPEPVHAAATLRVAATMEATTSTTEATSTEATSSTQQLPQDTNDGSGDSQQGERHGNTRSLQLSVPNVLEND